MVAQVLLALFFAGVATAGLRGWVVDTRQAGYGLSWTAAPHEAR